MNFNYQQDRGGGQGRGFFMGNSLSGAVRMLIAWNVILFLLQQIFRGQLEAMFGLRPSAVMHGAIWQPFTYMFLHGGLFHIFFNMIILWFFGSELENLWGTRRFVKYYFFTGVGAGLVSFFFHLMNTPNTQIIGASGAVFGVLLAYGLIFPNRPVLLFFVIPVPAKLLVLIYAGLEILLLLTPTNDGIAHDAHVGGLLFGWIFLKGSPLTGLYRKFRTQRQRRKFRVLEFHDRDRDDDDSGGWK